MRKRRPSRSASDTLVPRGKLMMQHKRAIGTRAPLAVPEAVNRRWSLDFGRASCGTDGESLWRQHPRQHPRRPSLIGPHLILWRAACFHSARGLCKLRSRAKRGPLHAWGREKRRSQRVVSIAEVQPWRSQPPRSRVDVAFGRPADIGANRPRLLVDPFAVSTDIEPSRLGSAKADSTLQRHKRGNIIN
jgi:hypothetical protein